MTVLIVGSGASAVAAAHPLVRAGKEVVMLDVGATDATYAPLIPAEPWLKLRRSDANQHRYFLGDRFEGIPFDRARVGAQLTPPRHYVAADAPRLLPRGGTGFVGLESTAQGGLASAWGAAISPWGPDDLAGLPVSHADLLPHYHAVADLMGVCGQPGDDLSDFLDDPPSMMPPLDPDAPARLILDAYSANRARLRRAGLALGHARLAACSREHDGRGPHPYHDMDFWCDHGRAVYRPRWTLERLLAFPNFTYLPGHLATAFEESGPGRVRVHATRLADSTERAFEGASLVLAAGALGTTRLVLRSLGRYDAPVPIVSNFSPYFPMLNLRMIGRACEDRRHSLTQLTGFYRPVDPSRGMVQLQVYSYRSLLTFKLLKEQPLAIPQARRMMQTLIPVLTLLGIHHEDNPAPAKHAVLRRGHSPTPGVPPDHLELNYAITPREDALQRQTEREVLRLFRSLGCFALRRIHLGFGASIHYAGSLPMRASPGPLETDSQGRLGSHHGVYVADSAVFPRLPAKGVTFTMMANAHRVGTMIASGTP